MILYNDTDFDMNQAPAQDHKKVLFLITKATWGGAQKYAFDLATHLPKDRFDVEVAFGDRGRLSSMLEEHDVKTYHLPALSRDIGLLTDMKSFFQILRLLRQVRPDVLHVNSSKAAALGALAARLSCVPRIIFTAHGWPFKEDRDQIARALIYFISWFTALLSHATIVVSKRDETIGKRMPFIAKKIRYIPIGIEPPAFLPRDEAAASLSISTSKPRIVTIAEFTKNKGINYAIDAVAELKKRDVSVECFIIGDGELREELERQARECGVDDRLHFLGFIEGASKYLKAFDIFVLPSIKEGMPYVLLEAAQAELPIVATDVIDSSSADPTRATIVPAANPQALSDALKQTLQKTKPASSRPEHILKDMVEQTTMHY
ncbi:MAG: hypothetical protein A2787_07790 [Omnitrophica WOR_2 bacterium RIFCSPHIGHO2_01_FULL_48_9]|nr:MAG: hypothetical protein A2787_07790 [Omnitrophica WOR_2 bacterium RIFCSPHIGHO2_01_FULL_48_9]